MEYVNLEQIADILNGYNFKSSNYVNDGVRVIRITNVQQGYLEDKDPVFYEYTKDLDKYMLKENDLLMSLTGNVGRVGMLVPCLLPAGLNQRVACIRCKNDNFSIKFLFYFFNNELFRKNAVSNSNGVAQLNLSTEWLKKVKIPAYDENKQYNIVEELDKIVDLIDDNKKQLTNLDNIVKSQFIEMFGSYKKDTPIANVTSEIKRGQWGDEPLLDEPNFKVIKTNNMEYDGTLDLSEVVVRNIKKEKFERNKLEWGDILVEKCGGTKTHSVGYSCLFLDNDDFVANNFIMILTPNKEKINPYFLQYQLRYMYESNDFVDCFNKTTGIQNLKVDLYKNKQICIPNIESQNKFADFVQQIDKSKYFGGVCYGIC